MNILLRKQIACLDPETVVKHNRDSRVQHQAPNKAKSVLESQMLLFVEAD